ITVSNTEGTLKREVKTDSSGNYSVDNLPSGDYLVVAEMQGYLTNASDAQTLETGQTLTLNLQLAAVQGATENVEVNAGGPGQVETTNATNSYTLTQQEVSAFPLNGRDAMQEITMSPGVTDQSGKDEHKVGLAGSAKYSVNGGRVEYNTFEV